MGRLLENENLNHWVYGIIFSTIFAVVNAITTFVIDAASLIVGATLGIILYIIVMPYITCRLVYYVSDKLMD